MNLAINPENKYVHWKQQVKQQTQLLFGNYRILIHFLFPICILWMFEIFGFWRFFDFKETGIKIIMFVWMLLSVYTFLLLIIPFAKTNNKKLIIWLGFGINFALWGLIGNVILNLFQPYIFTGMSAQSIWLFLLLGNWAFFSFYYLFDIYNQQKQFNQFKLKLEKKIDAENKFLKTQINPHFLFNTLNNIYSQSLKSPQNAATTTHNLKDLLQYMLYDCEQDFVPLSKETAFIESYVNIETIRNSSKKVKIDLQITGDTNEQKVAPLLIINFIENAFKHSLQSNEDGAFINIALHIEHKDLHLQVANSISKIENQTLGIGRDGGIGMRNVEKRLQLLYPNRHQLLLQTPNNNFQVDLKIQLY